VSRICGIYRAGGAAKAADARLVESALRNMPGRQIAVIQKGGASLGRIAFANSDLGGGVAEACGWVVALDGGIFNAETLSGDTRPDIDHAGILAGMLAQHGVERTLQRLEGDFAAVAYDARNDCLLLLRDRFGVKPLYWTKIDGGIAWASQPRALLTLPDVSADFNARFVARFAGLHYRTFDNFPTESPYADIAQVPAGTFVQIAQGRVGNARRYWSLEQAPDFPDSESDLAGRYRSLLLDAVAKRVRVAKRPAFTLSGGLDSSSVLCSAAAITGQKQHAVSSIYRDPTFDERHEIMDVAGDGVAAWSPIEIPDDVALFDDVRRLVRLHDEPVATATWLSHEVVASHAAADGFTALFGGLGGDELNAGEYEYFPLFFADLKTQGRLAELEAEIAAWSRLHDHPIYRKSPQVAYDMIERVADPSSPGRCLPDQRRLQRYADTVDPDFIDLSSFRPVMEAPFTSYLKNRTFQDMFRETLPCCLRAEDRQCTAVGLQHFDPFLDHVLVEFMYRIPGTLKIRDGVTKRLLRSAMRGILPESTRTRVAKVGWNAPAHIWFTGRNLADLRDMVRSRGFRERGIYRVREVERLLDEHVDIVRSGAVKENHMMFLWQLVNLELWLQAVPELAGRATPSRRSIGAYDAQA
jgi:asparagine synthase (glutamine-hydrolysing)